MKTLAVESAAFFCLAFALAGNLQAEEAFDDLFEGEVLSPSEALETNSIADTKTGLSVAGDLLYRSLLSVPREFFSGDPQAPTTFIHYGQVDLLFDLRLEKGIKAFASSSLLINPAYTEVFGVARPASDSTAPSPSQSVVVNEFFIDLNLAFAAYFRIGKQLLKWGRGFFWNPADLIDLDRKDATDLGRRRQGRSGLRFLVPVGTRFNVVAFAALEEENLERSAVAIKVEGVLGATEVALSAWAKKGRKPIAAAELSTGLLGFQGYGELALASETFDERPVRLGDGSWSLERLEEVSVKGVLGLSRSFGDGGKNLVGTEVFANSEGFGEPAPTDDSLHRLLHQKPLPDLQWGSLYASFYLSWNELFGKTTSAHVNAIVNASDGSFLLSLPLRWVPVYQMSVSFGPNVYGGAADREFTHRRLGATFFVDFKVSF